MTGIVRLLPTLLCLLVATGGSWRARCEGVDRRAAEVVARTDDPGPDGELDTEDDIHTANELHIVANEVYHYQLESRDVLHNFSIPVFRLKQDAVPGRRITGWF